MTHDLYGAKETNPLPDGYHDEQSKFTVDWTDKRLFKIERLRLVSDPGFPMWDVTYCTGRLHDGTKVDVGLPFDQLPKGRFAVASAIIQYAKRDKVYAKGLGIFDAISTLI